MSEDLELFTAEAYDLLDKIEEGLLALEKSPSKSELLPEIFGFLHNVKANSLYLQLDKYVHVCQVAEEFLDKNSKAATIPTPEEFDLLLNFVDISRSYVGALSESETPVEALDGWLIRAEGASSNEN